MYILTFFILLFPIQLYSVASAFSFFGKIYSLRGITDKNNRVIGREYVTHKKRGEKSITTHYIYTPAPHRIFLGTLTQIGQTYESEPASQRKLYEGLSDPKGLFYTIIQIIATKDT